MSDSYLKGQHTGLHTYRFENNPEERRFAEAWGQIADRGHLEWLLGDGQQQAHDLTERDAHVAATIIQWLGSPVGEGFLRDLGYVKKD